MSLSTDFGIEKKIENKLNLAEVGQNFKAVKCYLENDTLKSRAYLTFIGSKIVFIILVPGGILLARTVLNL